MQHSCFEAIVNHKITVCLTSGQKQNSYTKLGSGVSEKVHPTPAHKTWSIPSIHFPW